MCDQCLVRVICVEETQVLVCCRYSEFCFGEVAVLSAVAPTAHLYPHQSCITCVQINTHHISASIYYSMYTFTTMLC